MEHTVESMLALFVKVRRFYASNLQNKFPNFSPNEISVLILLSNNPHISTSSELVLYLDVSKGLVSRSIDSLVKKGLVVLSDDEKDGRIQRISLSEASHDLIDSLKIEIKKINDRIFKNIDEEEIMQMENTISKIISEFKKGGCL